jgi:eukaryotic-like serine/threonine-protein kinase
VPDDRSPSADARLSMGRYLLISEIARGSFGRLWSACSRLDSGEAEAVLLRRLSKKPPLDDVALDAIRQAAEAATSIELEGVAAVRGVEETEDELAIVHEYANGKDLRTLLGLASLKRMLIPPEVAVHLALCTLDALGRLEGALPGGLAGAAVGPDSVFLREDGATLLLDAGIASAISRKPGHGKFVQLISYSAPEELDDPADFSRSDVFRSGVLLWEMLAGKRLFNAHSPQAAMDQLRKAPIRELEGVDPSLAEVVARALERDPEQRFPSSEAMAQALASSATPRAGNSEAAAWAHEIVGIALGSQQRATKRAMAKVVKRSTNVLPVARVLPPPRPPVSHFEVTKQIELPLPPEAIGPPAAETTREIEIAVPPEAVRPPDSAGRRAATKTLLGVPAPGILPAKRPMPLPPTPEQRAEDSTVTLQDNVDSRLRVGEATPINDSAITLLDDIIEPRPAPPEIVNGSITDLLDLPERPLPPPLTTDSISNLLEHPGSFQMPSTATALASDPEFADDATEVTPFLELEAPREQPRKAKKVLVVAAVVLGMMLPGALAWALLKSRSSATAESLAASSSAAAAFEEVPTGATSAKPATAPEPAASLARAPAASSAASADEPDAGPPDKASLVATKKDDAATLAAAAKAKAERAKQIEAWKKAHKTSTKKQTKKHKAPSTKQKKHTGKKHKKPVKKLKK